MVRKPGPKSRLLSSSERIIIRYVAEHQPCTNREIQAYMGYRSTASVNSYVQRLRILGILTTPRTRWGNSISRGIQLERDILVSANGDFYWIVRADEYREVQSDSTAAGSFPTATPSL